ncbi:MAG: hypothetical protein P8O03_13425 [Ilumatobacter sp.]|nr:hypothetical protein [Ilumatobacter sp.]
MGAPAIGFGVGSVRGLPISVETKPLFNGLAIIDASAIQQRTTIVITNPAGDLGRNGAIFSSCEFVRAFVRLVVIAALKRCVARDMFADRLGAGTGPS